MRLRYLLLKRKNKSQIGNTRVPTGNARIFLAKFSNAYNNTLRMYQNLEQSVLAPSLEMETSYEAAGYLWSGKSRAFHVAEQKIDE